MVKRCRSEESRIWVEIIILIIPHVTESEECLRLIASRIKEELGQDMPWHVNGYFPRDYYAFEFYGSAIFQDAQMKARLGTVKFF
ncbi:MAG: hypothetical protein SWO11_22470 [Thermodesulfobacteriota bacterium]|nr:hypothetical protein [Thermodesulfobacteriota bacterium]